MEKSEGEALADKLFPKDTEEYAESILDIPPEQRRLHTETYDYSIATIRDSLASEHIFIPRFQRGFVWTEPQASRLIESLIIQCPIPVIYLSQEQDERLSVIDGNQRLRSIQKFLENQFELRGLTAYPELERLHYFELDPRFQRHILNRTLRCIVIMKDTHPQVRFDIFERLNTGAVKLSAQELRHGIYHGSFIDWTDKEASSKKWRELIHARSDKRMKAEEFILRFLAFHFALEKYEKPLAGFLNQFAEDHRSADEKMLGKFKEALTVAVQRVEWVFGDLAFKVYDREDGNRILSHFNAALFDAEMLGVSHAPPEITKLTAAARKNILSELGDLFFEDQFQRSITLATSDGAQIKARVKTVRDLITKHL
jgi:hypothetical protein